MNMYAVIVTTTDGLHGWNGHRSFSTTYRFCHTYYHALFNEAGFYKLSWGGGEVCHQNEICVWNQPLPFPWSTQEPGNKKILSLKWNIYILIITTSAMKVGIPPCTTGKSPESDGAMDFSLSAFLKCLNIFLNMVPCQRDETNMRKAYVGFPPTYWRQVVSSCPWEKSRAFLRRWGSPKLNPSRMGAWNCLSWRNQKIFSLSPLIKLTIKQTKSIFLHCPFPLLSTSWFSHHTLKHTQKTEVSNGENITALRNGEMRWRENVTRG